MQKNEKIRYAYGLKTIALGMWAILTIITCNGVWNYAPEALTKWSAVITLVLTLLVIWRFGKRLYCEYRQSMREYFDSNKSE